MEKEIEAIVGEAEQISRFEQQVMEELQAQRVYTVLASSLLVVASSSHIGGDEEMLDSISGTKVGAWLMSPPLSSN